METEHTLWPATISKHRIASIPISPCFRQPAGELLLGIRWHWEVGSKKASSATNYDLLVTCLSAGSPVAVSPVTTGSSMTNRAPCG